MELTCLAPTNHDVAKPWYIHVAVEFIAQQRFVFLVVPYVVHTPDLSPEGHEIPRIGLGVYKNTGPECVEAVSAALKVGYR